MYIGTNQNGCGGEQLCGTLPGDTMRGVDYTIICDIVGDYIKIVSGDNRLSFAKV